jgi:serine/threonine protein phosphatase PrpC
VTDARLEIAAGFATAKGPKADNQDFGGVHLGTAAEQREHGVVAVIADGVSGSKAGRMADDAQLYRRLSGSEPAERHRRQRDQGA